MEKENTSKRDNYSVILYALMIVAGILFVSPLIFTFLSSFKNNTEIFSSPFALPENFSADNYINAWSSANMGRYLFNSLVIAMSVVVITLLVATPASFMLSRFKLKINKPLRILFLVGMMFPLHTVMVPIAYTIGAFNLKNNIFFLILLYVAFALPFSIMVISTFMQGIDKSLEEAAVIDGASYFQVFFKVIVPMSTPSLATVSIFNFLSAWNDIIFPLLVINDDRLKTISLGLLNFSGERGTNYGPLMAAIMITVAVPLIIYLLFQEKVESGLSAGAVKG